MVERELGALEDVLCSLRRQQQIVRGEVVPHEPSLVAPLAGPRILGGHAVPSQGVQPANHISQVEALWGGEGHLHEVRVLQVVVAGQVVHHRRPRPWLVPPGWRRRRRLRLHPDSRLGAHPGRAGTPPRPPLHGAPWILQRHICMVYVDLLLLLLLLVDGG